MMSSPGTVKDVPVGSGGGGTPPRPLDPGDGGRGEPSPAFGADPARFGLWLFLGTITMLFVGFTSAYLVRRASGGWRAIAPPALLWFNTAALLASSFTMERARRRLRSWDLPGARQGLSLTGALGVLFVLGQLAAWRSLAAQGIFLASSPHSSFFYLLTGLHALHLVGGLVWFAVTFAQLRRMTLTPGEDGLGLFATYWHFLGALWVYLFLLLFVF
jgi:cytochrome c oxidase subunit 3